MFYKFNKFLVELPRSSKIIVKFLFDTLVFFSSIFIVKVFNSYNNIFQDLFYLIIASLSFSIISFLLGLYKSFIRFFTTISLLKTLLVTISIYIILFIIKLDETIGVFNWFSSLFFTFTMLTLPRLILREILIKERIENKLKVGIIGNNFESYELFDLLKRTRKYEPVCFITPHKKISIFNSLSIPEFHIKKFLVNNSKLQVDLILTPLNVIKEVWFKSVIESLEFLKIPIYKSKNLDDFIISKNQNINLTPLSMTDLIIRNPQLPINELLKRNIIGKSILVSGGGGSIGSELCKQIVTQSPKQLIILDNSEFNLYQIEDDVNNLITSLNLNIKIITKLCSILDRSLLKQVFQEYKIDCVFHAAAYKHVPIVEKNPIIGFENNVIGTRNLAELSLEFKVGRFTLISTDKAVNPTNIMGVTKRFAEMICQSIAKDNEHTKFAIVRFGNVLGSSGSVIPKFEKQIAAGGPITVTHPDVTRYFMSITEAAELVVQASTMAEKCEFFVLDMGKPINILDLAKRLCSLRGLTSYCLTEGSDTGDIEILITGLRDGEKLYEELLVSQETFSTEHPRIFSAKEDFIPLEKINLTLDKIKSSLKTKDLKSIKEIFSTLPQVNYSKEHMLKFIENFSKKE